MGEERTSFIIRDEAIKKRAISVINDLALDPISEVVIKPYKVNLSAQQRKQYFVWCGYIGDELGNTKQEQHLIFKQKLLVPILEREDEEYAEMVESIRDVYRQDKNKGMSFMTQVVKLTSITDRIVNMQVMREYMTDVDRWAAEMGIRLPVKDNLDKRAWRR